jgi:hypothetical protein
MKVELMYFKESGKWYMTQEVEIVCTNDYWEAITAVEEKTAQSRNLSWFTILVTGKGMPFEIPHLIK